MPIQLVALTTIKSDEEEALDKYLNVVGPLMESAGAKVVSRIQLGECIVGSNEIQYVSVMEYPDKASIKLVFDSDEYKSLETVKRNAFSVYQVSIATSI